MAISRTREARPARLPSRDAVALEQLPTLFRCWYSGQHEGRIAVARTPGIDDHGLRGNGGVASAAARSGQHPSFQVQAGVDHKRCLCVALRQRERQGRSQARRWACSGLSLSRPGGLAGRFLAGCGGMGVRIMKTVTLGVSSRAASKRRLAGALAGQAQGEFIAFASVELLWKVLTAKRW